VKVAAILIGSEDVRRRLLQIGGGAAHQALAATAEEVEEIVGNEAGKHTKSGALFRSVYLRRSGDGWEIGHDLQVAPHALFVHWGTRPHVIRPKKKKALRWPAGGRFVFATKVAHPGYKGDPWLVRAARQSPSIFEHHINQQIDRIANGE
jgi:hypothetical protein